MTRTTDMNQRIGRFTYIDSIFEPCKLSYAILAAMILHFAVIYLVGDKIALAKENFTPSLEIILASNPADKAPDQADYLADKAQEGGGEHDEKNIPQEEMQAMAGMGIPLEVSQNNQQIITTISPTSASEVVVSNDVMELPEINDTKDLSAAEAEMANLSEIVARQREAWAKRPRRRHISAATFEARDAKYLEMWRQHIEKIGNENYPLEARALNLSGELRVLVAINADGSLHDATIRRSSGSQILDDAAINIVKLAAPFELLTDEMKQDTDILEIIRTWQFTNDGLVTE